MELLIPLLIFGAGLVFSGIKSANESKKQAQRKIDLSKLERPAGKAPLGKQPSRVEEKKEDKSFWQSLVDDFKEEYEKVEQGQKVREERTSTPERQANSASKRLEQDIRSKVNRPERTKTRADRNTNTRETQKVEPIEAVVSEVERVVKEPASRSQSSQNKKAAFSVKDISFDEKAIVNGIIMNEILGPPKSKQRRRR